MLRDWLSGFFAPTWDWIQVEVTSRCRASCSYCPRTSLKDVWQDRDMPLALFERLSPGVARAGLVYLQGWGEPLLHPDFPAMVKSAKKSGCMVGATTNGMPLDQALAEDLVRSGLDILAFSLAGTGEGNDAARRGAPFSRVMEAVELLGRAKKSLGSSLPAVHIAYMLLRSNFDDVRELPRVLEGKGVGQVVISTLDYLPGPGLEGEVIAPGTVEEYREVKDLLDAVAEEGGKRGMQVYGQFPHPVTRRTICTENVARALFVSSDGEVSPCVFHSLPERLSFGNLNGATLADIWKSEAYRNFRKAFTGENPPEPCRGCPKLRIV
jgi:radical SAM protein with 4Fe4S-binding SPASM domain